MVLASDGKNPKEVGKTDPEEKSAIEVETIAEDDQSTENGVSYFQSFYTPESDSTMSSVSKYNFLFYFIYKYKYEKEITDFEELRKLSTH